MNTTAWHCVPMRWHRSVIIFLFHTAVAVDGFILHNNTTNARLPKHTYKSESERRGERVREGASRATLDNMLRHSFLLTVTILSIVTQLLNCTPFCNTISLNKNWSLVCSEGLHCAKANAASGLGQIHDFCHFPFKQIENMKEKTWDTCEFRILYFVSQFSTDDLLHQFQCRFCLTRNFIKFCFK